MTTRSAALAAASLQAVLNPVLLALWAHWLPYDYAGRMSGRVTAISVASGTIAGVAAACTMTGYLHQDTSRHSTRQRARIAAALLAGCLAAFAVFNVAVAEAGLWRMSSG